MPNRPAIVFEPPSFIQVLERGHNYLLIRLGGQRGSGKSTVASNGTISLVTGFVILLIAGGLFMVFRFFPGFDLQLLWLALGVGTICMVIGYVLRTHRLWLRFERGAQMATFGSSLAGKAFRHHTIPLSDVQEVQLTSEIREVEIYEDTKGPVTFYKVLLIATDRVFVLAEVPEAFHLPYETARAIAEFTGKDFVDATRLEGPLRVKPEDLRLSLVELLRRDGVPKEHPRPKKPSIRVIQEPLQFTFKWIHVDFQAVLLFDFITVILIIIVWYFFEQQENLFRGYSFWGIATLTLLAIAFFPLVVMSFLATLKNLYCPCQITLDQQDLTYTEGWVLSRRYSVRAGEIREIRFGASTDPRLEVVGAETIIRLRPSRFGEEMRWLEVELKRCLGVLFGCAF